MADPVRLTLSLHPCNACGEDAHVTWYAWRDPAYRAACQACDAMQEASTPEAAQTLWDGHNPSLDVATLRNSKEQQALRERKAAARRAEIAAFLAQRLTPEALDVLRYATAAYVSEEGSYDFDPSEFLAWCCRMGNKPCPDELHEEAYAYMSSRDSGIFGAVTDTE